MPQAIRWEWLAFIVCYFVIIAFLGFWGHRRTKSTADFYVASRTLSAPIMILYFSSGYVSAATMVAFIGHGYAYGWAMLSYTGAACGIPIGFMLLHLIGPKLRRFGGYTTADVCEARYYDKYIRGWVSIVYVFLMLEFTILQFSGIGVILNTVVGIPYFWGVILVGLVVVLYTSFGGSFSVAWTDLLQAILMLGGVFIAAPYLLSMVGGFSAMNAALAKISGGPINVPKGALVDPFAGGLIPPVLAITTTIGLGLATACQTYYHRMYYSCRDTSTVKAMIGVSSPILGVFFFCIGLIACATRVIEPNLPKADMAFPYVVSTHLPPVIGAIAIGAILGAIMSSTDAILLACGTNLTHDIFHHYIKPQASEEELRRFAKIITLIIGIPPVFIALHPPPMLIALWAWFVAGLSGFIFIPLFGGLYWKRATREAAWISSIVGTVLAIGWTTAGNPYGIPALLITLPIALALFIGVSLVTKPPPKTAIEPFFSKTRTV